MCEYWHILIIRDIAARMLSVLVKTFLAGGTFSSTYKLFYTLTAGEDKHCPFAKIMTAVSMANIKKPVEPYIDSTMTLSDILG